MEKKVVRLAKLEKPQRVLDEATGTGDLAIALKSTGAKEIIGLDISPGMLEIGAEKIKSLSLDHQIKMVLGDGESCSKKIISTSLRWPLVCGILNNLNWV